MKSLYETWRNYVDETKVINLHRYAFNKASMELYKWFEDLMHFDTTIDKDDPEYQKRLIEKAEFMKYAFLERLDNYHVDDALFFIGIESVHIPSEYMNDLLDIMEEYEKRKALL